MNEGSLDREGVLHRMLRSLVTSDNDGKRTRFQTQYTHCGKSAYDEKKVDEQL